MAGNKTALLPTVSASKVNLTQFDSASSVNKFSVNKSVGRGSQVAFSTKKDGNSNLNEHFFDFGFENKTRKLSERIVNSKQKINYSNQKDITKRILDVLQKEPKIINEDIDKHSLETRSIQIKE